MRTFPAMAHYATQMQARSLISPAHLIRNMLQVPPLSYYVRYYVTNPITPVENDPTTPPATCTVPPTGQSRTAPKPTSPPSDDSIPVSGYVHLLVPDVQPDDKVAASNPSTLSGSDCSGRLPSKVLHDPLPVGGKLREAKATSQWYQQCNELDDKCYKRIQKQVAEQDQKLAAEQDKWYQRNQKIASQYATEIQ